jgi:hypothetical protein
VREKAAVRPCDAEVVCLYWDDGENALDEGGTGRPTSRGGELDPDEKLGDGDGSDRNIVLVADQLVESEVLALG